MLAWLHGGVIHTVSAASARNILILNSYHPGYNWSDGEQAALLQTLIQARPDLLPRIEYLDWRRFPNPNRIPLFLTQLDQKYGHHTFDLIIALDDPAVDLVLNHRSFFGTKVPIVFGGVNGSDIDRLQSQPEVTGVMQTYDFGGTLSLLRHLQPNVRRVTVVHCDTESGLATRRAFEHFLSQSPQPYAFDWCENWTADELLARLAALPHDRAVLLLSIFRDRNGRVLNDDAKFGQTMAARTPVPIYFVGPPLVKHFGSSGWDNAVWQGLGGSLMSPDLHGEQVAKLVLRVLDGEPIDRIPIIRHSPSRLAVDYPQLHRFGLSLADLPEGTTVYQPPSSFYEINRIPILVGGITIAVLGITVIVLLAFIWQRRRSNRALRRSHEHFQLIARATNDAVWDWDLSTDAMWWNEGYVEQMQLPKGSPPSLAAWESHLHPEDRTFIMESLRSATAPGGNDHLTLEYRVVRPDQSTRFVYDRIFIAHNADGAAQRMLGARLDLTERRQAEQQQLRLGTAIQQSAEAILLIDPDGSITYTNPAFTQITGHGPPSNLKQLYRTLLPPSATLRSFESIKEIVQYSGRWSARLDGVKHDGTSCMLEAHINPIRDLQGHIVSYVLVGQDISREAKLEDQVRLSQKMKAIGQLAGGIAHDFNNLLQIITGCVAQVESVPTPSEQKECLNQIKNSIAQGAQLTRQLLIFSRNETVAFVTVDLNQVLARQLRLLTHLLGERVRLTFIPTENAYPVKGDQGQLEQVFMNLCINARDAMPDGGEIVVKVEDTLIDSNFCLGHPWARPGHFMLVSVTDHGCGMDKATLAKIFDPFFTTKGKDHGTGLGLAVVYGIVEKHHGFLYVYSDPGLGTTFRIYLPVDENGVLPPPTAPTPPSAEVKQAAPAPAKGSTILLAEDEVLVRNFAVKILRRHGYKVLGAKDGTEAYTIYRAHAKEIDLVILDSMMPGKTGGEVLELIRADIPTMPVVLCSGYGISSLPSELSSESGIKLLAKPYDLATLLGTVQELMQGRATS